MKKVLFSLLALLSCMTVSAVSLTRGPISLQKRTPSISIPGTTTIPRTEPVALVSAFQNLDEIVVTSDAVSATVTVTVYNVHGMVVESVTEDLTIGDDITLDLSTLPAGEYVLEVSFDDTIYVGQFEL